MKKNSTNLKKRIILYFAYILSIIIMVTKQLSLIHNSDPIILVIVSFVSLIEYTIVFLLYIYIYSMIATFFFRNKSIMENAKILYAYLLCLEEIILVTLQFNIFIMIIVAVLVFAVGQIYLYTLIKSNNKGKKIVLIIIDLIIFIISICSLIIYHI
jgi:hypothetical protein